MTTWLVFCTSPKVTPALVRELQSADKESISLNPFMPARYDPCANHEASTSHVEEHVEVFEHKTDEELRSLAAERARPPNGAKPKFLVDSPFLVLDERSATDKTAVVHALSADTFAEFDERGDPIELPDAPVSASDFEWWTWRISIKSSYRMLVIFEFVAETEQLLFVREKARFTNDDGIFDVERALDWFEFPAGGCDGMAKLA